MQHGLGDLRIADVLADMDLLLLARRAALSSIEDPESRAFLLPTLMRQYQDRFKHILEV